MSTPATRATDHPTVVSNLECQVRAEQDLAAIERQLTEHSQRRESLAWKISSQENAIGGFEANEERYGDQLTDARFELQGLLGQRAALDAAVVNLQEQARQLTDGLAAIRPGCEAGAVADHQRRVDAAEADLDQLDVLIAEHQAELAESRRIADPLAPLMRRREDTLAGIAQGEGDKASLQLVDAEIQAASAEHDQEIARRETVIEETSQALAGLQRRRQAAATDVMHLRALAPKVLDQFLLGEIEKIARAYDRHAVKLRDTLRRLVALEQLRDTNGQRTTGTSVPLEISKTYVPTLSGTGESHRHGREHTAPLLAGPDLLPGAEFLSVVLDEERRNLAEVGITDL